MNPISPKDDAQPRSLVPALGEEMLVILHLPKTAGRSLLDSLAAAVPWQEKLDLYGIQRTSEHITQEIRAMDPVARDRIRLVIGHQVWFGIHEVFGRRARYVTFMRDPVARVFSDYDMVRREERNMFHERVNREGVSLRTFIERKISPYVENHLAAMLARESVDDAHNVSLCRGMNEELLVRAAGRLRECWFVGLAETFDADRSLLFRALGLAEQYVDSNQAGREQRQARPVGDLELIRMTARLNWADEILYHLATLLHETGVDRLRGEIERREGKQ